MGGGEALGSFNPPQGGSVADPCGGDPGFIPLRGILLVGIVFPCLGYLIYCKQHIAVGISLQAIYLFILKGKKNTKEKKDCYTNQ